MTVRGIPAPLRYSPGLYWEENVSSQLSLLLANAEHHLDNPEFQRDMLETVRASVRKIGALLRRLAEPADGMGGAGRVEPTVVSVWVPLRRATVLGLLLSLPAFLIHEKLNTVHEWTEMPEWAWIVLASILVFVISRAHEWMTELAVLLFDRDFRRAERRLEEAGHDIRRAGSVAEIERRLVEEPLKALRLASAAIFRHEEGTLRRSESIGWEARHRATLSDGEPPLPAVAPGAPFPIAGAGAGLPGDLARPVLAVPIGNPRRRFALAVYSAHESGTDLDGAERELLAQLARDAEIAYGQVEREALLREIERLKSLIQDAARRA